MGGVGRAHPLHIIRQVRLAPDGVDALDAVRVEIWRPDDLRNATHHLNRRRKHAGRVRRICPRDKRTVKVIRRNLSAHRSCRSCKRTIHASVLRFQLKRNPLRFRNIHTNR